MLENLLSPQQLDLLEDYRALESTEDKLTWLMERQPVIPPLSLEERLDTRKIQGCLSGLWIQGSQSEGRCQFRATSDSGVVAGIASFLCDIHSGLTSEEITAIGFHVSSALKLESILSMTRKRAVQSVMNYIISYAQQNTVL
jgi:cysteine desulfuration protein SufE